MYMIPEYNKIDFEKDDLAVVKAKVKILKEAVEDGRLSQEEYLAEKERVLKEYEKCRTLLGYAFTW